MRFGDLDAAIRLIAGDSDGRQWWPRSYVEDKEPTATLTASLFDLDQFARHRGSHRFRMRCERKPEVFGAFQQILACIHR